MNIDPIEPEANYIVFQSPSFKFSRKASSSYSLKLEPPNKQKIKTRRKPLSTPASPNRSREPQCTCMTPEQFARLRNQDPRYRGPCGEPMFGRGCPASSKCGITLPNQPGASTLPRTLGRSTEMEMIQGRGDKIAAATSSASLYDNVNNANSTPGKNLKSTDSIKLKEKQQQNETCQTTPKTASVATGTANVGSQVGRILSNIDRTMSILISSYRSEVPRRSVHRYPRRSRRNRAKRHRRNRTRLSERLWSLKEPRPEEHCRINLIVRSSSIIQNPRITPSWRCRMVTYST